MTVRLAEHHSNCSNSNNCNSSHHHHTAPQEERNRHERLDVSPHEYYNDNDDNNPYNNYYSAPRLSAWVTPLRRRHRHTTTPVVDGLPERCSWSSTVTAASSVSSQSRSSDRPRDEHDAAPTTTALCSHCHALLREDDIVSPWESIRQTWRQRRFRQQALQQQRRQQQTQRARQLHQQYLRQCRHWLIPAQQPLKMLWDILTVLVSISHAYLTHVAIRDRQFSHPALRFCEVWFVGDFILSFFSQKQVTPTRILTTYQSVWANYLTSWFVVDVLALLPTEVWFIQPIIERQNRRNLFVKSLFRTHGVFHFVRLLRAKHFVWFGQIASTTHTMGWGGRPRLLRVLIKYVPKYLLFVKTMKAMVFIRVLRMIHHLRRVYWWSYHGYRGHWWSWFSEQPTQPLGHSGPITPVGLNNVVVESPRRRSNDHEYYDEWEWDAVSPSPTTTTTTYRCWSLPPRQVPSSFVMNHNTDNDDTDTEPLEYVNHHDDDDDDNVY